MKIFQQVDLFIFVLFYFGKTNNNIRDSRKFI